MLSESEKQMVVWVQNGGKRIGCFPSWSRGWLGAVAHCCCPAPGKLIYHCSRTDQNSQFKVWFLLNVYCFCTIKSKYHKSNHFKLRTITFMKTKWMIKTKFKLLSSFKQERERIWERATQGMQAYLILSCFTLLHSTDTMFFTRFVATWHRTSL